MLILGIDPGTAVTGFGVVRGEGVGAATLVECGVLRTSPRHGLPDRLCELFDGVTALLERHRPDAVAVESIFYARNVRTTITLGHARGVLLLAAAKAALPIHEYPPAEIKKAITGTGAATKEQVQYMVKTLLRLKTVPSPNDAADGVAAALTCLLTARTQARIAGQLERAR
ncbi:MAG: crossover junction endodeoxyribonuclease RuvC [Gemmatimonadaceae bacterium]|nr:crossover junction endodeoxyribonuclease RuvC [Gemmatimonadaceae bacterium]